MRHGSTAPCASSASEHSAHCGFSRFHVMAWNAGSRTVALSTLSSAMALPFSIDAVAASIAAPPMK